MTGITFHPIGHVRGGRTLLDAGALAPVQRA